MKHSSKTILALLLSVLMLLGAMPLTLVGAEVDCIAEVQENAPATFTSVDYTTQYIKFVPETSDRYVFWLSGGKGGSVELYNESLSYQGYYFNSNCLHVSYNLTAGQTYYYSVYLYNSGLEVTANVKKAADYVTDELQTADTLALNTPQTLTLSQGTFHFYQFTATEAVSHIIYAAGTNSSVYFVGFSNDLYTVYNYNSPRNAYTTFSLNADETYYFGVYVYSTEPQDMQITIATSEQYVQNVIAPTAEVLTAGTPKTAAVSSTEECYFSFTPSETARYAFWTDGLSSGELRLYDSSMNGEYGNAYAPRPMMTYNTLNAGETYYLSASSYSGVTENITLHVDTSRNYVAAYIAPGLSELTLGEPLEVTASSTYSYVKFTAPADGSYLFLGDNEEYVSATVYDDELTDGAGGSGTPFTITKTLTAGSTYYLQLYCWDEPVDPFHVTVCNTVDYVDGQATLLTLNTPLPVTVPGGKTLYFKFIPDETTSYMLYGDNTVGLGCNIYDSQMQYVPFSGGGVPQTIQCTLNAGETYYFAINGWSSETASFNLTIETKRDYYYDLATPLTLNVPAEITLDGYNTVYARFTPPTDDIYILVADNEEYVNASLTEDTFETIEYCNGTNITLQGDFSADDTYFYYFSGNSSDSNGAFTVTVYKLRDYLTDHAVLLENGGTYTVDGRGNQYFVFTAPETGNYTLASQSDSIHPKAFLLDSDLNELARKEGTFSDDFELEYTLTEGETYYYRTRSENSGTYTLTFARTCDHVSTTEYPATEATCTTNGYTAGVYCNVCGAWLSGHMKIRAMHKDADGDRVCDTCGEPAIYKVYDCNEEGTVTATFYANGDLVVAGEGDMAFIGGNEEAEPEDWVEEAFLYGMINGVKYIEIAEGVTSVCDGAFQQMPAQKIVIASTVASIGQGAFHRIGASDITILNDTVPLSNQIPLPGYYVNGNTPFPFESYKSYSDFNYGVMFAEYAAMVGGIYVDNLDTLIEMAIQSYIEEGLTEEQARAEIDRVLNEELFYVVYEFNASFGTNATTLPELAAQLLAKVNAVLGTSYTSWSDYADVSLGEDGETNPTVIYKESFYDTIEAVFGVDWEALRDLSYSTDGYYLGRTPGRLTPFADVTVHANCGSTAQTAAATSRVKFDSLKHDWNEEGETLEAATCTTSGTMLVTCKYCDATETREIPATGEHTWDEGEITTTATCVTEGIKTYTCASCNGTRTENLGKDMDNHVGTDVLKNQKDATCKEDGYTGDICCSACGNVKTAGSVISKTTVAHSGKKIEAKANTCEAAGNKEYYTCTVCGKLFNDAACTQETTAAAVTIPAKGHAYGAWTTVRQASCSQEGLEQRVCANDGSHKETRPISKTAHVDDGNGYCRNCGADLKSSQRCKCGQIHTGPFAWLIKFFHGIRYFFTHLFNK